MTTTNNIEGLVGVSLGQIKEMLGINTIVGDPIHTPSGDTILPISRVGVGFVAGGSELRTEHSHDEALQGAVNPNSLPFGGGSGGGVSITPIAFLVVGMQGVKVVPLDNQTHLLDKVIDSAPAIIDKMSGMFGSSAQSQGQGQAQGQSGSSNSSASTSTGMGMNMNSGGSNLQ